MAENLIPGMKVAVVDCTRMNDIGKEKKIMGVPTYAIAKKNKDEILLSPGTSFIKAFDMLKKEMGL